MRIWGYTHPAVLCRQHLLSEHNELHTLLAGGWRNHPEAHRFRGEARRYLCLRHELLRVEMARRWPDGRHDPANHPTPLEPDDARLLDDDDVRLETVVDALPVLVGEGCDELMIAQAAFGRVMARIGFPPTRLECDTPWERDKMSLLSYLRLGDDWSSAYRDGARPEGSTLPVG